MDGAADRARLARLRGSLSGIRADAGDAVQGRYVRATAPGDEPTAWRRRLAGRRGLRGQGGGSEAVRRPAALRSARHRRPRSPTLEPPRTRMAEIHWPG